MYFLTSLKKLSLNNNGIEVRHPVLFLAQRRADASRACARCRHVACSVYWRVTATGERSSGAGTADYVVQAVSYPCCCRSCRCWWRSRHRSLDSVVRCVRLLRSWSHVVVSLHTCFPC